MNNNYKPAVTAKDLAESFARCSTAAADVGVSFEQLSALIRSANTVSKVSGLEISKSLEGVVACHACYGNQK